MLAKANVMTFRKCGTQGRVNKMVLHAANHAFAKAFLIKHFRRSERVRQHMTETLQVAGCVEGGVLGVAAATVQRSLDAALRAVRGTAEAHVLTTAALRHLVRFRGVRNRVSFA